MFENPTNGRQARNFTTNVPNIPDLKSSSEQIFSENCRWVARTIPKSFVMFYFTMLGSHIDLYFGIDCQTTLQVQEKLISRSPFEITLLLLWPDQLARNRKPDTGQHWNSTKNINFAMEIKVTN